MEDQNPPLGKSTAAEALDVVVRGERNGMLLSEIEVKPEDWYFDPIETDGVTVYAIKETLNDQLVGYVTEEGKRLLLRLAYHRLVREIQREEQILAKTNFKLRKLKKENSPKFWELLRFQRKVVAALDILAAYVADLRGN